MPYTERQRRFFLAELARKKKNKKTRTGLSADKLSEMIHSPLKKEILRKG